MSEYEKAWSKIILNSCFESTGSHVSVLYDAEKMKSIQETSSKISILSKMLFDSE